MENTNFSKRELQVVELLLCGKPTKLIALELNISTRTVELHLTGIYKNLGVKSRAEALIRLMSLFKR